MVAHADNPALASFAPEITLRVRPSRGRAHLIQQIFDVNPTATPGFLSHFNDDELEEYLEHLTTACDRRGRDTVWVRRCSQRAIAAHEND